MNLLRRAWSPCSCAHLFHAAPTDAPPQLVCPSTVAAHPPRDGGVEVGQRSVATDLRGATALGGFRGGFMNAYCARCSALALPRSSALRIAGRALRALGQAELELIEDG